MFWFQQQCNRLVKITKQVFACNYCDAPLGSIYFFNKLIWTTKLKIHRIFIRCNNLCSAVFKQEQVNVKFSFQEQYILNEGANVLAPWKQKYFLAVGWLFFSMECCFCAASLHFMSAVSSCCYFTFYFSNWLEVEFNKLIIFNAKNNFVLCK